MKGDLKRNIKKDSLIREINRLEKEVREILNSDGDACKTDSDIIAYKKVIAEKKIELDNM